MMHEGLSIYGQDNLKIDVRDAALAAANAVLSRTGITAREAVKAAGVDLLLAEGLEPEERTDAHFREHGSTMEALEAHNEARDAAAAEIARLEPDSADFVIMFSVSV
jgi:hypothetical protein